MTGYLKQLFSQPKGILFILVLASLLFLELVIFPALDYESKIRSKINITRERLEKLTVLKEKIDRIKKNISYEIVGTKPSASLFSQIENIAHQARVKENIEFMRPVTNRKTGQQQSQQIEIRLKDIYLLPLADFLTRLEDRTIQISRISIRSKESSPGQLNVNLIAVQQ